jgi:osmotically-inducible protein OsmY
MISDAIKGVRPLLFTVALMAAGASLTGCIPLVIGGAAAGTAVVVTDRRSSGSQIDDQSIEFKIESEMGKKFGDTARINASSYEGQVLLVGDVPNDAAKEQATGIARGVLKVKSVVNQLNIGPVQPFSANSNDTWLTSKVRSALLNARYVPSGSIAVTTDHSVVYLQGKVTELEGQYAATAAAEVGGIAKVVKLFDTISREDAIRLSNGAGNDSSKSGAPVEQKAAPIESGGAPGTGGSIDGGSAVQAMPIK